MSSKSDVALSIRGLSKSYTIAHGGLKRPSFREAVVDKLRNPFRRAETETFWALNDVSFDVHKGDVVGIIGRNGAGKSTLLKILSRITEPTRGEIDVYGRIGSLLEVGTGFHPELTGRENIYLNGAILGMRRAEITRQFDAIVDFAEVEKFLDTPVKRYSSGMYVRLAFAVAAHLNPEILIVDEVLAVGDAQFQKKCLGKMKSVSREDGRTVLFVSHNLAAVTALCNRCAFLTNGKLTLEGESGPVLGRYISDGGSQKTASFDTSKNLQSAVVFSACSVRNRADEAAGTFRTDEPANVLLSFQCRRPVDGVEVTFRVENNIGQPIFSSNLSDATKELHRFEAGEHRLSVELPTRFLVPGQYSLTIGAHRPGAEVLDLHSNAVTFTLEDTGSSMSRYQGQDYGVVLVDLPWSKI